MSKLESMDNLFAGRHFDREVIILCVRWYLRYKLSLRDLVEMMAERLHTRRSCAGYSDMHRSSSNAGTVLANPVAHRGVLMRPASRCAVTGSKGTRLRSSKYLNNLNEQDHRGIKSRTRPMLGFKNFDCAAITIAGVELLHRIRKSQFALGRLRLKGQAAPAIWNAVLAA
jgi:transposase-like protein